MDPLLRIGLSHTDTCMAALAPDGRILAIDAVGAGWMGARPEEVVGQGPWVFGGLIGEEEWPAVWLRIVDEGHLMVESLVVGPQGQARRLTAQLSHVPADGERKPYALVVAMRHAPVHGAPAGDALTRLHYASAFIDDPLFDWNVVTDELTFNVAAARLIGVAPGVRLTGREARALKPGVAGRLVPELRALIAGERERAECLHRFDRPDGRGCHLLLRLRVGAWSPDGQALRVVLHVVDVTRQQQALEAAREQQELFAAVAHSTTAAILMLDARGIIVFANERAEAVLGLSRSTRPGRLYASPVWCRPGADGGPSPEVMRPFLRVMASGAPVHGVSHVLEYPDGTRRQLRINGEPLFDAAGAISRVLFSVDDITDQVEAAERLARSEQRLRAVLDRLSVGVHLVAADGRLLFSNRAARGYAELEGPVGDVRRLTLAGRQVLDADGRPLPPERYPLGRALAHGEAIHGAEVGIEVCAGGPVRWFRVGASPQLDDGGAVVDVVAEMVDITAERQLEGRLREARALEAIGRLAGGVAHDFNNLLTVILSEADALSCGLSVDDPLQAGIGGIRAAGARGAALTRALLGFARRQFRQPYAVEVRPMVEGMWRRWRRRAGARLDGTLDIAFDAERVHLDPEQFEQVFEALLDNARDAMEGVGRLRVTVEPFEPPADDPRWPTLAAGRCLRLVVADTGPGVGHDDADRIFEPFFSTRSRGLRAGLGLANAHGILQQNGGDIRLAANRPTGATFEVLWPMAPGESG